MKEIEVLQGTFGNYLHIRPAIFQKFTLEALLLVREIISKSHDEINQTCIEDMAKEVRNRQEAIDKLVGRESVRLIEKGV